MVLGLFLFKSKIRLVAKHYDQKSYTDFHETFAHVSHIGSITDMAAIADKLGLKIHQLHVALAYLIGELI